MTHCEHCGWEWHLANAKTACSRVATIQCASSSRRTEGGASSSEVHNMVAEELDRAVERSRTQKGRRNHCRCRLELSRWRRHRRGPYSEICVRWSCLCRRNRARKVERGHAKVGGSDQTATLALRVTSVFRLEHDVWKLVHRHADPITTPRPAASVINQ